MLPLPRKVSVKELLSRFCSRRQTRTPKLCVVLSRADDPSLFLFRPPFFLCFFALFPHRVLRVCRKAAEKILETNLSELFNVCLGRRLLYAYERVQVR